MQYYTPASSKWPFDHPNGGHLTPERVTLKTQKGHWEEPSFGIFSIYFDLTLVFQIPCQEVWKDPLRAEPQEVFGGFKHQLTRYLGSTRVKVSKYLVHNL